MTRRLRILAAGCLLLLLGIGVFFLLHGEPPVLTIGVYAGSYWETPNGDSYQILDHAIDRFTEQVPGVRVTYVSGIPSDSYSEWLAEQILKGTEPDLYFVLPEDFSLLAASGALARLDGLMTSDPDFDASLFYQPCLQSGSFQGVQYALPYESVPTIMFVNKTLLEENEIAKPDSLWMWDDFYHICQQVTDVERRQFGCYDYTWLNALYANGAELFSEDGKTCHLADEKIQAAVQFVKDLNALNDGYTVTAKDFDLGNVAFRPFLFSEYRAYQPYPWRVKKYSGFEWDCVRMPAGPDGSGVSELHTMLLGISARTKRKDLAWQFAKLLSMDPGVQKELYTYSHGISPVQRIAEDREILARLHADIPGGGGFGPGIIHDIMSTAAIVPRFDNYDRALSMAENAVTDVLSGSDTNRLLTAQREITIYLNQF